MSAANLRNKFKEKVAEEGLLTFVEKNPAYKGLHTWLAKLLEAEEAGRSSFSTSYLHLSVDDQRLLHRLGYRTILTYEHKTECIPQGLFNRPKVIQVPCLKHVIYWE